MDLNPLNIYLINQVHNDLEEAEEAVEDAVNVEVEPAVIEEAFRNPFVALSEEEFIKCYRLSKQLTRDLINLLTPHMVWPSRASALSIEKKVLVVLRFFACGSYQEITGSNAYAFMSQSSVSRSIHEVAMALNLPDIFDAWVKFPNVAEMEILRRRFFNKYGFPGVIGCVDCTHVAIVRNTEDPEYPEHVYVNRKMYHSINVQLICDDNLKIINVNARFPGSVHDARIWNLSNVSRAMEQLYRHDPNNSFFLLGDSGYPLRPWLQTPIRNPAPGTREERYNNRLTSIRSIIERCNGVLKNRFRCLLKHRVLHYRPPVASAIINACVVLHNMCVENNVNLMLEDEENEVNVDMELGIVQDAAAQNVNPNIGIWRLEEN